MIVEALTLAAIATGYAAKPVSVECRPGLGLSGNAYVGGNAITMGADACQRARHGDGVGLLILLHETAHTRGVEDEGDATCYALERIRDLAHRLHFSATRAYRQAYLYNRAQHPAYWCTR